MDLLSLPRPIGVDLTRIPDMNGRLNLSGEKNVSCPSLDDPRASGGGGCPVAHAGIIVQPRSKLKPRGPRNDLQDGLSQPDASRCCLWCRPVRRSGSRFACQSWRDHRPSALVIAANAGSTDTPSILIIRVLSATPRVAERGSDVNR